MLVDTTQPWNAPITYRSFAELTQEQGRCWTNFREWFDDVERYVISVGMEETGVAVTSPAVGRFLWIEGVNAIVAQDPSYILERLADAPSFPLVWPDTYSVEETVNLLNELHDLKSLQFPEGDNLVLANDLREQAIKTLERSQVYATL